jgi:hypothetical protein
VKRASSSLLKYTISILEKAKLFDMKQKRESLYWRYIIFLCRYGKEVSFLFFVLFIVFSFLRYVHHYFRRKEKKNQREHTYMYSVQRFAYQTAVSVYIEHNYCHAECMHKVSTFLSYLFVTHSLACFFFSFSLSVYMYALLLRSFLFFFVFTCCTRDSV